MTQPGLQRHLGLTSAILLVVGSVIGSGIFMKPLVISQALPDATWILGAWAVLGFVCLCGALAYGELGAMFPQAGGQYAFLREAYGPFVAFLYGWCLLLVITRGRWLPCASRSPRTSIASYRCRRGHGSPLPLPWCCCLRR